MEMENIDAKGLLSKYGKMTHILVPAANVALLFSIKMKIANCQN
jgi:hypothetical protein